VLVLKRDWCRRERVGDGVRFNKGHGHKDHNIKLLRPQHPFGVTVFGCGLNVSRTTQLGPALMVVPPHTVATPTRGVSGNPEARRQQSSSPLPPVLRSFRMHASGSAIGGVNAEHAYGS
jgi:hypothetical protein